MKNKELEEQLKSSIEKIELNDFSTVWENIEDRLEPEADLPGSAISVESVVLANNIGTVKNKVKNISLFILSGLILIGVVLAIVLPLVLKNTTDSIKYHNEEELSFRYVAEEEFYGKSEISKLNSLAFPFEKEAFELIIAKDDIIKGGRFSFFDESTGSEGKLGFYDKSVIFTTDYKEFQSNLVIENAKVYYNEKEITNEFKSYEAVIEMNNANYKLDIILYSETNLLQFIEKYFH